MGRLFTSTNAHSQLFIKQTIARNLIWGGLLLSAIWSLSSLTGTIEYISGSVFIDYNGDDVENGYDQFTPIVDVNVYADIDGSGDLSTGDQILGYSRTDEDGNYSIDIDYSGNISRRVASDDDDVEEDTSNGYVYTNSSDLEMVMDGSTHQIIGIHFDSLFLSSAATLNSFYLEFKAKNSSPAGVTLKIFAELSPNSSPFVSEDYDVSRRTKTTDSVIWNTGSWSTNNLYQTPDLRALVAEITSLPDWRPGNGISFIIEGSSGTKRAYSRPTDGPQMVLSYTLPSYDYIVAVDTQSLASFAQITEHYMPRGTISNLDLGFKGEIPYCLTASDDPDQLYHMNDVKGYSYAAPNQTGTTNIEAIAYDPYSQKIYAVNANVFGTIDSETGVFSSIGTQIGTGDGSLGAISLSDIDGLAFDPFSGDLYGTHRRTSNDLLIKIDTADGSYVADAFGSGVDYVPISVPYADMSIDDIAISPVDGKLYAINNGSSSWEFLLTIDMLSGAHTLIDTIKYQDSGLRDIEGLSITPKGELRATTGNTGPADRVNSLYDISPVTAEAEILGSFESGSDFESCECLIAAPNDFNGYVYEDANNNQTLDGGEVVYENAKVMIYRDVNRDGLVDAGDVLIDSVLSLSNGYYEWFTTSQEDFVMSLDLSTIPLTHVLTTDAQEVAGFSSHYGGTTDAGNNFGLIDENSLPVVWGESKVEWAGENASIEWSTYAETNNAAFAVERSQDRKQFQEIGQLEARNTGSQYQAYTFQDAGAAKLSGKKLYYRIRQIDLDGEYSFSPVMILSLQAAGAIDLSVFPNPASEIVTIQYQALSDGPQSLLIYSANGQLVRQEKLSGQLNEVELDVRNWAAGIYWVQVLSEDRVQREKLIVR